MTTSLWSVERYLFLAKRDLQGVGEDVRDGEHLDGAPPELGEAPVVRLAGIDQRQVVLIAARTRCVRCQALHIQATLEMSDAATGASWYIRSNCGPDFI